MNFCLPARAIIDDDFNYLTREVEIQYTVAGSSLINIICLDRLMVDEHIEKLIIPNTYIDNKGHTNKIELIAENVFSKKSAGSGSLIGVEESNKILFLDIDDSIEYINSRAFSSLRGLVKVKWPKNCLVIPEQCFLYSKLEEIEGINNVECIDTQAFAYCRIKNFTWPEKCPKIPNGCFYRCHLLESIDLNDSITQIGSEAFSKCTHLKSIKWPKKCSVIDKYCFFNCEHLQTINITDCLNEIRESAFAGSGILHIDLSSMLISHIAENAFPPMCNVIYPYYV